jgi:hypothetical protein
MDKLPPLPLNPTAAPLSLEQQFLVRHWQDQCQGMTQPDLAELAAVLYEQMLIRDNYYKALIKKDWGL